MNVNPAGDVESVEATPAEVILSNKDVTVPESVARSTEVESQAPIQLNVPIEVRRSWTISTGRNKTFSVEHIKAVAIADAVTTMGNYAFILTRGQQAPQLDLQRLRAYLEVIVEQFDTEKGIALAIETDKEFNLPAEVYTRDQETLNSLKSLSAVIETVQARGLENRFNADRVRACIPESYPQFE